MYWPFDFTRSPLQQQQGFATAMNTVDDISYCPSAEEKTRNAEQIDVTGRRNWKLMKGKKEAVWPPSLEAVLLEALKIYKPHSSKPLEQLGRFPMRNRFISDYIYEMTGKRRTPKQVGSRLQQLRDTCKKSELLKLISRRNASDEHSHIPTRPPSPQLSQIQIPTPINHRQSNIIDVEIILDDRPGPLPIPAVHLKSVDSSPIPLRIRLAAPLIHQTISPVASRIETSGRESIVEIHSPCPLFNQTIFSVFCRGSEKPTHYEIGSLRCHSSPPETHSWIYSSPLIPAFWGALCKDKEPANYTIQQGIIPLRPLPGSRHTDRSEMTITLVYRFILPANKTHPEHEGKVIPLFTTSPLYPNFSYERFEGDEPLPHGSRSSQSRAISPPRSPRTGGQNTRTRCSNITDVILPHVPFSYLSSNPSKGYGSCAVGGPPQRRCHSCGPWLQPINVYEGRLPLNTSFHHAGCPTSF